MVLTFITHLLISNKDYVMQTSKAVLKLSNYFVASGKTPLESYEEIKWAFKALDQAPHVLKSIDTIILTESGLTIKVQNTSAKKVIKILSKSKYTYYKITDINGYEFECGESFETNRGNISQSIIDLVHLFTKD